MSARDPGFRITLQEAKDSATKGGIPIGGTIVNYNRDVL